MTRFAGSLNGRDPSADLLRSGRGRENPHCSTWASFQSGEVKRLSKSATIGWSCLVVKPLKRVRFPRVWPTFRLRTGTWIFSEPDRLPHAKLVAVRSPEDGARPPTHANF